MGQRFSLTLTVRGRGVSLGKQFNINGLPDDSLLAIGKFQELPAHRESEGGTTIDVRQFRSTVEARRPGGFTASPTLNYQTLVQQRTWFGTSTFQSPGSVRIVPLSFVIHPLPPEGRPDSFSGAIGQFHFDMTALPTDVAPGDLVTLTLQISGDGPLDAIACPSLQGTKGFKVYPPNRVGGDDQHLRFNQIVIPESLDAVHTPSANFSYFDPLRGQYVTVSAPPIALKFHARGEVPTFTPYRPPTEPVVGAEGSQSPGGSTGPGEAWHQPNRATVRALAFVLGALSIVAVLVGVLRRTRHHRTSKASSPAFRQSWKRPFVGGLTGLVLAVAVLAVPERQGPERVRLRADTDARFGPSRRGEILFTAPSGTVVTVSEHWQGWAKITAGRGAGWVEFPPLHATPTADDTP